MWQVMLGCGGGWTKGRGLDLLSQTPGAQKAKGPAWKSCGYGKYINRIIPEQTWAGKVLLLHHSSLRNMEILEKSVRFCFPSEIHECIPTHMHMRVSRAWLQESPRKKALESCKFTIEEKKRIT